MFSEISSPKNSSFEQEEAFKYILSIQKRYCRGLVLKLEQYLWLVIKNVEHLVEFDFKFGAVSPPITSQICRIKSM